MLPELQHNFTTATKNLATWQDSGLSSSLGKQEDLASKETFYRMGIVNIALGAMHTCRQSESANKLSLQS